MPKEIVVTGLGSKIEYATTNGKGMITGKRENITDACIKDVFQHLMNEHKRNNVGDKSFGYSFDGLGEIHYLPANKKVKED